MDSDPGVITKVVQIDQTPEAQWALLRRCPFQLAHLKAIVETLEEELKRKEKLLSEVVAEEEKDKEILVISQAAIVEEQEERKE